MPYSSKKDVEFYGQLTSSDFGASGYSYDDGIQKAIADADRMLDEYCGAPEGFFASGGIEIQSEYLNGIDVVYTGNVIRFFGWYSGGTSHLKLKHKPVLSVTKLEEETSAGSWTTRTEGSSSDYIVVEDGVRYIQNTPSLQYKNIRVTYKAGYKITPGIISECSGRLAATILRNIINASKQESTTISGMTTSSPKASLIDEVLSDSLKVRLQNYRRVVYAFG